MPHHQIIIACRDHVEAEILRNAVKQPSTPTFTKASALLDAVASTPEAFIVMTPLLMDETACGILTKAAIIQPSHTIVYARHCDKSLNIIRMFGCGCAAVLGPDELGLLPDLLKPSESYLNELVMPPFFIDDDESTLKAPSTQSAEPLHVTFLGAQALMSCANALLNIKTSQAMSMSCVAPANTWARDHFISSLQEHTLWSGLTRPCIQQGSVTLCNDLNALFALEPTSKHIVICHGILTETEIQYLSTLSAETRVFTATDEGYMEQTANKLNAVIRSEQLWDVLISTLYGD